MEVLPPAPAGQMVFAKVPPPLKNEAYGFENAISYIHTRTFV